MVDNEMRPVRVSIRMRKCGLVDGLVAENDALCS